MRKEEIVSSAIVLVAVAGWAYLAYKLDKEAKPQKAFVWGGPALRKPADGGFNFERRKRLKEQTHLRVVK